MPVGADQGPVTNILQRKDEPSQKGRLMAYSAADESFTHQLPTTFDQVHDPDPTWSDRCYFFAASPDGTMLLASGYGNNPNTGSGLGYVKVSLADGRHWDLLSGRPVTGDDRGDLSAGPMRWTCVEPLKKWRLDVAPNSVRDRVGALLRTHRPDVGAIAHEGARQETARCWPTCTT